MTISNKLSYLNDTKNLLRESINQAGGSITEETPFREYPSWVNYVVWLNSGGLETLFSEGEGGVLWSSLPYFVDVDGETEATWGDPVGLIKDSSGNGNDFTQPTVTARPILGRVPRGGRRNLLHNSDRVLGGYAVNVAGASQSGPIGFLDKSVHIPAGATGSVRVPDYLPENGVGVSYAALIEMDDGSVPIIEGFPNPQVRVVAMNHDGLNIEITPYVGNAYLVTWGRETTPSPVLHNAGVFFGDAHPGCRLQIFHCNAGVPAAPFPYQHVTSDYDITEEGVPDVYYLNFDGTDDNLTTTLPAIENGTVVIAGTNGIWIDADYNFDGGTFSIGPTTYTNGPVGILTAIGDPIVGGLLVINRQLTQLERELVIQELKERGAPGVFGLASNVFSIDNATNVGAGIVVDTTEAFFARAPLVSPSTIDFSDGWVSDVFGWSIGDYILVELDVSEFSPGLLRVIHSGDGCFSGDPNRFYSDPGFFRRVLRVSQAAATLRFAFGSNNQAKVSSVSVRKLELIP